MSAGFLRALSLFTIAPVRIAPQLRPGEGSRALLWLPLIGGALGAGAGGIAALIGAVAEPGPLAGIAAVTTLALLTRALHLDGLADTIDGLGSRAQGAAALAIMRKSDIGPFGVVALILVLGADAAAIAQAPVSGGALVALVGLACGAGRAAAVASAVRGRPTAAGSGFGSLVAGAIPPAAAAAWAIAAIGSGSALGAIAGVGPWRWAAAQAAGIAIGWGVGLIASRRIGGMSGDVFGAVIEIGAAVALATAVMV